jgi:RNA polymerase sigma factor (TIGR02999 family)
MNDFTRILCAVKQGDPNASEALLPLVYDELRRLAARKMAQEPPGQTLQATALVHEAYLRLVDAPTAQHWDSRWHFFAAAGRAMRRILIENARRKRSHKHGGGWQRHDLLDVEIAIDPAGDDLLDVDEVLTHLEAERPDVARLVELRCFAGLTLPEAARSLGVSLRTANRRWVYARAWMRRALNQLPDRKS